MADEQHSPAPRRRPVDPKTPSRVSTWKPDPRWAHPVEAGLWCYVAGWIPQLGVPTWLMLVVGLAFGGLGVLRARRLRTDDELGEVALPRDQLSLLAAVAGPAAGLWWIRAGTSSPFVSIGWLVVGTAVLGTVYAVLRTQAATRVAQAKETVEKEKAVEVQNDWGRIFEQAGLKLQVLRIEETRAGYVLAVGPAEGQKAVSLETLRFKTEELTTLASAALAQHDVAVRAGDIRVEGTSVAHVHLVHVCTKHILTEQVPFVPIERPTTIVDPIDPALFEDGEPLELCFGGPQGGTNGKIVGATGSGKSVFTNAMIGKLGECVDCLIGVVASDKLVPLVYPWLKPWFAGKSERPAIDFVAGQDPQMVLEMLAAVYRMVKERNDRLANEPTHRPTPTAPAIVLFIEETGDMASRKDVVQTFDGRTVGFSELVYMITKADRSAQVSIELLNQMDLYGAFGDYGSEIARNTPFRACLKTLSSSDGPSVLPALTGKGTDTTKLTDHSMLVQPSINVPRVMPAKSYYLDGPAIGPVAVRNAGWRPELEDDIAAVLGVAWSQRWSAARLPELAAACRRDGLEWPMSDETDLDEELKMLIESEQQKDERPAPAPGGMPDVAADVAELDAITARMAEGGFTLPEPLDSVVRLLQDPGAPRDFIGTRTLAILLGRVAEDADDDVVTEAAKKLGREMSAIDDELRTEQRGRVRGYDVTVLKTVAGKLAGGGR